MAAVLTQSQLDQVHVAFIQPLVKLIEEQKMLLQEQAAKAEVLKTTVLQMEATNAKLREEDKGHDVCYWTVACW
jgi:hypothetical protein